MGVKGAWAGPGIPLAGLVKEWGWPVLPHLPLFPRLLTRARREKGRPLLLHASRDGRRAPKVKSHNHTDCGVSVR